MANDNGILPHLSLDGDGTDDVTAAAQARWRRLFAAAPPPTSLCAPIAAMAARTPHKLAVEAADEAITYAELEAAANGVAAKLRAAGAGPGVTVALLMERSIDYVAAALAAMKVGATFLPLATSWPALRISAVLADAGASVLLRRADSPQPDFDGLTVIEVDRRSDRGMAAPLAPVAADDVAYVIYTSGSTGLPKGVEITWGSFLHMVAWKWASYELSAADRVSWLASVAFDASLTELWPTLSIGATLVLADDEARMSPERLQAWLLQQRISVAPFVPPVLAERLLTAAWPADAGLRLVMSAGDALHVHPAPGQPFTVLNGYGPTECTVETTVGVVPPGVAEGPRPTIGVPMAGVAVHLLDAEGAPVADGEIGEIHIAGANVGRGYRNQPELTATKFVHDPSAAEPGARMYRTGDLGRRLPDGEIEFHGRIDEQIQIRGHRVDPAEVASALASHPGVASCAVIPSRNAHGPCLAAYVAPSPLGVTAEAARNYLAERLPDYMLPASFVLLPALPLNANGKLDRAALPAPAEAHMPAETAYRAPNAPAEELLAEVFAEVLKVPRVGVDDDFFLLGGYSLLAAAAAERASAIFGVELETATLFKHPTVASLAAEIEARLIRLLDAMSDEEAEQHLTGAREPAL